MGMRLKNNFSQRTRKELEFLKLEFHVDFKSTSVLPNIELESLMLELLQ